MKTIKVNLTTILAFTVLVTVSCSQKKDQGSSEPSLMAQSLAPAYMASTFDVNQYPLSKTVCDPFNNETPVNYTKGLKASLYYKTPGQVLASRAETYTSLAHASNQSLFFTDINVPTRNFNEGFLSQLNVPIKNDDGEKLIEYFALKYETTLMLGPGDLEGDYEFASLSDDGAVIKYINPHSESGNWENLVDNDGDHPTRLGCSLRRLHMTKDTKIPLQIHYYQGPRYHIANMMLWRKVTDSVSAEPLCGRSGNNFWFDPDNKSLPQQAFLDITARGWRIISQNNFNLPAQAPSGSDGDVSILTSYNPCVTGIEPGITNFSMTEAFLGGAIFTWRTDLPATSQLIIVNNVTGELVETVSDNNLRLDHRLVVENLRSGVSYTVKALSISDTLGKSLSQAIQLTSQ